MKGEPLNELPGWPAALNKKLAAAYCGLSPETFDKVCPVRPISFTGSSRGERYLRQRLDEWLAALDPNKQDAVPKRRFGDRLYADKVRPEDFETLEQWQEWREQERASEPQAVKAAKRGRK